MKKCKSQSKDRKRRDAARNRAKAIRTESNMRKNNTKRPSVKPKYAGLMTSIFGRKP